MPLLNTLLEDTTLFASKIPKDIVIPLVFLSLSLLSLFLLGRPRRPATRLPPGPKGWPIIGNLLDLGAMPHRTLTDMRGQYGGVIWLRLGALNTMVISSAEASTELFKNHDLSFADRSITDVMRAHGYNEGSLALAPYGSFWRTLRRLVTVDMIVHRRINETAHLRRKCVDDMISWVEEEARKGTTNGDLCNSSGGIHLAKFVFLASFNVLGRLMLSRDMSDPSSEEAAKLFAAMESMMEWSGHPNVVDFFPWLKWLDPQGLRRKMERDLGKALELGSKFVREKVEQRRRKKRKGEGDRDKDFLDVLLDYRGSDKEDDGEPAKISERDLAIFIMEIFMAGTDTTSSTIEWAMTELLLNPSSMAMVKTELSQVVGPTRKLEESDVENLPFLQAVVKESLRLHPPIPFLIPRKATNDTKFMGYNIPKDTQVYINVWAIGKDPKVWEDPMKFRPERFIGSKVDYKGQHYEFTPFGAGRRMCAGWPLASRMLNLILGSLLHEFDWELPTGVTPAGLDMNDRLGVTMRKAEALLVVAKNCKQL